MCRDLNSEDAAELGDAPASGGYLRYHNSTNLGAAKAGSECATRAAAGGCRAFGYAERRSITLFESPLLGRPLPRVAAVLENLASVRTESKK